MMMSLHSSSGSSVEASPSLFDTGPWRHMPFWVEQRQRLTHELDAALRARPPDSDDAPLLLLRAQPPSWLGGDTLSTLSVGNALKSLYLYLWLAHARGQIQLTTASTVHEGFMGILQLQVPAATRDAFDADLFPTPTALRIAESRFPFARKTLQKLWQSAGLVLFYPPVCTMGDAFLRFDEPLRQRLRAQIERADTLRHMRALRDEKRAHQQQQQQQAKRAKLADAETQTEPNLLLTHTETLLLGALATLRQAQPCPPSSESAGSF